MNEHGLADRPEFRRIEAFVRAANAPGGGAVTVGVGDDAAVLEVPVGESLLLSSDLSVEGIHFRREWMTWEEIGYRAAASALSDMAAMAACPIAALVGAALPPEMDDAVFEALGAGIGECLRAYDTGLAGGDVSRSPGPVMVDVVVAGLAADPIRRSGAREGQDVWVTGTIGAAGLAAAVLEAGADPDDSVLRAFKRPIPRVHEARWLAANAGLGAMIDLSDGLAGDAQHVAAASGCRLALEIEALPLHPAVSGLEFVDQALAFAVGGGEDYELLFTADPGRVESVRSGFGAEFDVGLRRIGRVERGRGVAWIGPDGRETDPPGAGFDHFAATVE